MNLSRPAAPSLPTRLAFAAIAGHLGVTVRRVPHVERRHLLRFDAAEAEAWLEPSRVIPNLAADTPTPRGTSRTRTP